MNHFGSLPLRKNRGKPLQRSISDASAKKSKRNSILSLFNTSNNNSNTARKSIDSGTSSTGRKRVERSKSDAGRRRGSNDSNSSTGSKTKRERFKFRLSKTNPNTNLTNNSSDSDNFLSVTAPKKIQLSPITESHNRSDYFDELDDTTKKKVKEKSNNNKLINDSGNIGFTSHEDLDLIPTTESRRQKQALFAKSKSLDEMHSSQLPPEKPTLTKGVAVDNMIKRLSNGRMSPPPQVLTLGGFSYLASSPPTASSTLIQTKHKSLSPLTTTNTNPLDTGNETANDIVYAQVVRNETKHANGNKTIYKETIHNTIKKYRSTSPPNNKASNHNNYDTVDFVTATTNSNNNISSSIKENSYLSQKSKSKHVNDIDEGLGNEVKIKINNDYQFRNGHDDHYLNDEPIIKPNIRNRAPSKYSTTTTTTTHITNSYNHNNHHNHNDLHNFDVRDMDVNDLSYRREILESRIRSRIDGLQRGGHEPHGYRQRTVSPPAVTGRYHRYGSNEILDRYSPERTHHEIITPITIENSYTVHKPAKYRKDYVDSTLRRSSHYYSKNDKVDSGIENDFRRNSYEKPRRPSRFNIG